MLGEVLAGEDAVLILFLRLVAQDQDDFAFDIQAGVIVVMEFGSGDPVTGEDDRGREPGGAGEVKGDEVFGEAEGRGPDDGR